MTYYSDADPLVKITLISITAVDQVLQNVFQDIALAACVCNEFGG